MSFMGLSLQSPPAWLVSAGSRVRARAVDVDQKLSFYLCWASLALAYLAGIETVVHWIWPGVLTSRVDLWIPALQWGLIAGLSSLGLGILVRSAWLFHRCRRALFCTTTRTEETLALWRGSWIHACDAPDNLFLAWPWSLALGTLLLVQRFELASIATVVFSCAFAVAALLARNEAWKERLEITLFMAPIILLALAGDFSDTRRAKNKTRGGYDWEKDYEAIPQTLRNTMGQCAQDIVFGSSHEPAFHRAMVKAFNGGRFTAMEQAQQLQSSVPQVRPVPVAPAQRRL